MKSRPQVTARERGSRQKRRAPRVDGIATRKRIVEAAGRLYAARGSAEVTSTKIADAAGVDPASIIFHFGNRRGLDHAVLAEAHSRLISISTIEQLALGGGSPKDRLRVLIEAFVNGVNSRPSWHTQVLARAMSAPSPNLAVLIQREAVPKIQGMFQLLSEITAIPVGDPAIVRCLLNVGAPFLLLFVAPPGIPGPVQQIRKMPHSELANHLFDYAWGGLNAVGRKYAHGGTGRRRNLRE